MAIVRWSPFEGVDELFNRMLPALARGNARALPDWSPSADISETEKEYLIRAELPAVKREDVKVTLDQGLITISGERRQLKEENSEKFHRVESFHGSFSRSFTLPENIAADAISCESRDGVLTIHLPKQQAKKPVPVEIKVN